MGRIVNLEEGLNILEEGIVKARMILNGFHTNEVFTAEEYMKFYDCVYFLCTQPTNDNSMHLLLRFQRALEESISLKVLPSLQGKSDATLLMELTNLWAKYKVMAKCLVGFFLYLDRHDKISGSLNNISLNCFRDMVCNVHYPKFRDATIFLINQDRTNNQIDRVLIKNVLDFFHEIGSFRNNDYYDNLEMAIVQDTATHYSRLASEWLACYSSNDYIQKAEWCLQKEIPGLAQYLPQSTVEKLLQVVQWHLMDSCESQLIEKQKTENNLTTYQELVSRCGSLSIEEDRKPSSSSMEQ